MASKVMKGIVAPILFPLRSLTKEEAASSVAEISSTTCRECHVVEAEAPANGQHQLARQRRERAILEAGPLALAKRSQVKKAAVDILVTIS